MGSGVDDPWRESVTIWFQSDGSQCGEIYQSEGLWHMFSKHDLFQLGGDLETKEYADAAMRHYCRAK